MTDTSSGQSPSADEISERMDKLGQDANLGEGNAEPDPATADNPPRPSQQGDRERDQR